MKQVIDQESEEAAAYSGKRKLKRHKFRRLDAKRHFRVGFHRPSRSCGFLDGKATPSEFRTSQYYRNALS
ncbi:MAG TPA: hypothetical protein VGG59_00820, partial [Acidobacteriaceae bacterium]